MDTKTAFHYIADAVLQTPYASLVGAFCLVYFVVYPTFVYYKNPKGLRRFPNMSLFSGVSDIPFIIMAHRGARSKELVAIHQNRKEPVLRIGPNSLSYSDPRAIKENYGHNAKTTKDGFYETTSGSHSHLADVVDKHEHARKRKVLSAAYSLKNLENWEHKVADKTVRIIKHFDKCCTSPIDIKNTTPAKEDLTVDYRLWTNFFTLDAISDIGLSDSLEFLDAGNDKLTIRRADGTSYECNFRESLYSNSRKQSHIVWAYEWYPFIDKLSNIIPFHGRLGKLSAKWDGIPGELARRRLEKYEAGQKLDDFFQALMEDKNGNPNNLEWGEIVAEVSIMMNAGSVTTAIAMTNVLYALLKNPKAMKTLVEELDMALVDSEDEEYDTERPEPGVVSYDNLKHLPYLKACLDEALRLYPPTPHNLGRQTQPEGISVMDDYIAGGVSVGMSALSVHWNAELFPQPDQYIPERWLGEQGKNLQPYFLAFTAGARGCIGRNISYLEQNVLLGTILRRYEFALPSPDWELDRDEVACWRYASQDLAKAETCSLISTSYS